MKPVKNKLSAWGILMLTGAFLLLSFCPLRNVLVRLAHPEPARKAQPAPDYAKVTSGKECVNFTMVHHQAAQPALALVPLFDFKISYRQFSGAAPLAVADCYIATRRLYLRNCAFLI